MISDEQILMLAACDMEGVLAEAFASDILRFGRNLIEASQQVQGEQFGNTGHGHVWERPDGLKARCGGVQLCSQCKSDEALFKSAKAMPAPKQNDNQLLSMGMDQPVSMYRAVNKLIEAADILLNQKNYDGTGHELITEAKNQAAGYLRSFRPVPTPKQEPVGWADLSRINDFDAPRLTKVKFTGNQSPVYANPMPPQAAAIPDKQYDIDLIHRAARHLEAVINEHPYCDYVQVVKHFADIRLKERSLSAAPKPEGE